MGCKPSPIFRDHLLMILLRLINISSKLLFVVRRYPYTLFIKSKPGRMFSSVEGYVTETKGLIEQERNAEVEESRFLVEQISHKILEKRGLCFSNVSMESSKTGLYGRRVITFVSGNPSRKDLPSSTISSGDIVDLRFKNSHDSLLSGIVTAVRSKSITVAFDQDDETGSLHDDGSYSLVKLTNDVTYKRLKRALDFMRSGKQKPADSLIDVCFSSGYKGLPTDLDRDQLIFENESLDESQRSAVFHALSQRYISIVHGPPGTGKSTTVVEIIQQLVKQGLKVLACAPSNIAVDNLVIRLANGKVKVTRLGHPARASHTIQQFSLDAKVSHSDDQALVEDIKKEIDSILKNGHANRRAAANRQELKTLRKELRQRSDTAVKQVLKHTDVVLSTLTSASDDGPLKLIKDDFFDVVVIDECSQALESACWIALLHAPKCVLAGDHLQLPPTIKCNKAAESGLAVTLMERLVKQYPDLSSMLTVQYRMNSLIMDWASRELYESKLTAAESVASHLLHQLPGVEENELTSTPLLLIDTAGCDLHELDISDEMSKGNEGEADLVKIHVEELVEAGMQQHDIAVITPYNLQVEMIRIRLGEKLHRVEVRSVDGYQGREKEAVVLSLVRSNKRGEVGFLAEDRRLNVAVTRARRHVSVVCDSSTVKSHGFLARFVEYMKEHGITRSAAEYQQEHSIGLRSEHINKLIMEHKTENTRVQKPPSESSRKTAGAEPKSEKPKAEKLNTEKPKSEKPPSAIVIQQPTEGGKQATVSVKKAEEESREKELTEKFSNMFERFIKSAETTLTLDNSLNSYERMIAHQVADNMKIQHESQGEGKERCVILSKLEICSTKPPRVQKHQKKPEPLPPATQTETEKETEEIPTEKCHVCHKQIPKTNLVLHSLRCLPTESTSENNDTQPAAPNSNSKPSARPKSSKARNIKEQNKKVVVSAKEKLENIPDDDFDALLDAAARLNGICNFFKCKTLVQTLGVTCPYCSARFCLSHSMAEIHGCGDAVRAEARRTFKNEARLYNGSGKPSKKSKEATRAQLEKKLTEKKAEFSQQRKQKVKEKK